MTISHKQAGLILEGTIVNLAIAACREYPQLRLYARSPAAVHDGPADQEPPEMDRAEIVGQIIREIAGRWSRGATEGIELDHARMERDVLAVIWKP